MQLKLRLQSITRHAELLADDELGETLVGLVRTAVENRTAAAVATVARPQRIDFIGLQGVVDKNLPVNPFVASLATADVQPAAGDAFAVGVMGTVRLRQPDGSSSAPLAVVFLEWPDCRWWLWRGLVDPVANAVKTETETVTRAVDGDPLPPGFGRWWSFARRKNLRAKLSLPGPALVH